MDQLVARARNAANVEENSFSKILQELRRTSTLYTILESSDPAIRGFANFLRYYMVFKGASLEQIKQLAELFLMSQLMLASKKASKPLQEPESLLRVFAYNRVMRDIDAFNALMLQAIYKNAQRPAQTNLVLKEAMKQMVESYLETNRILRDIIRQPLRKKKLAFSTDRVLSRHMLAKEPMKTQSLMKSLPSFQGGALKDEWTRARASADNWQVYPAPVVQKIILEMIRSAKEDIIILARQGYVSKSILAEIENRSKQGLNVTLITDSDYPVRDGERERLNIKTMNKVPVTMFIKDNYEVLAVLYPETPESCFGTKFFLKRRKSS